MLLPLLVRLHVQLTGASTLWHLAAMSSEPSVFSLPAWAKGQLLCRNPLPSAPTGTVETA